MVSTQTTNATSVFCSSGSPFYHTVMLPKDADRMSNIVDHDQTAPTDQTVRAVWGRI